jgi:hypothetical protein
MRSKTATTSSAVSVLAVAELHAFAQVEGDAEAVVGDGPGRGQRRHQVLLRVEGDQRVEDVLEHLVARHGRRDVRIEPDGFLGPGGDQRAAARLREGEAGQGQRGA